jgi:hypothetical protein
VKSDDVRLFATTYPRSLRREVREVAAPDRPAVVALGDDEFVLYGFLGECGGEVLIGL